MKYIPGAKRREARKVVNHNTYEQNIEQFAREWFSDPENLAKVEKYEIAAAKVVAYRDTYLGSKEIIDPEIRLKIHYPNGKPLVLLV